MFAIAWPLRRVRTLWVLLVRGRGLSHPPMWCLGGEDAGQHRDPWVLHVERGGEGPSAEGFVAAKVGKLRHGGTQGQEQGDGGGWGRAERTCVCACSHACVHVCTRLC